MLAKEIISDRYVTTPEVKEILIKRSKADELRYEQRTALDYTTRFSRITGKEASRLVAKLMKEIEGLKEHQAVLIVNLLPIDKDDLQLIFAKERIRLDDTKIDAILRIAKSAKLIDLSKIESELKKTQKAEKEALETKKAEKEALETKKEKIEEEKKEEEKTAKRADKREKAEKSK